MNTKPADPPTTLTDAELARRAGDSVDKAGAEAAYHALFDRHAPRLLAYLSSRVKRAEAEDICQETWLRIFIGLGEGDRFDGEKFRPWMFKIANNLTIDRHRRERLKTTSLEGNGQGKPIDPIDRRSSSDPFAERREALAHCLARLSKEERTVFQSRCEGVKPSAMAERAKVTPERIHKLLHQAKAKLTACLGGSKS